MCTTAKRDIGIEDVRRMAYMGRVLKHLPFPAGDAEGPVCAWNLKQDERSAYYRRIVNARAAYRGMFREDMQAALERQGEAVASLLAEDGMPAALEGVEITRQAVATGYQDIYTTVLPAFAEKTFEGLQQKAIGDTWLNAALAFVRDQGAQLVSLVQQTTKDLLGAIIANGFEQGQSIPAIVQQIRSQWPDVARYRAVRIVRTEVITASNVGQITGARSTADAFGFDLVKEWVATEDGRTRISHRIADEQQRPLNAPFTVHGFPAMYPADPSLPPAERVNCRCTVSFIVQE